MATAQEDTVFWNRKMLDIAHKRERTGWVDIKEEYLFSKDNFFVRNKEAFRLANNDSMKHLLSTKKDELGYTRHLFQQTYKGIMIEGAEYTLHEKNERIFCANGYLVEGLNCSVEPKISEATALKYALEYIGAKKYAWEIDYVSLLDDEDKDDEILLSYYKKTPAYHYPKGTLVLTLFSDSLSTRAENYVLAYKFKISAIEPSSSNAIYVNAHTGKIVKNYSLEISSGNCNDGNALTRYNGWQIIVTYKRAGAAGKYITRDECRGNGIYTSKRGVVGNDTWVYYKDADNNWSLEEERPATSAHWAMEMTYDYFNDVHGRNWHYGSQPMIIHIITESNNAYYNNAKWDDNELYFAFGIGNKITRNPIVALDVVAHEYTHAITDDEIDLKYLDESGALSESFSNIFGAVVEFYYLGSNGNYYQGDSVVLDGVGMYSNMTNPHHTNQPKIYKDDPYWYNGTDDYGGVHTNCGVMNYWFYLLAEGDNTNNESGYWVDGIGIEKAAKIVYRTITSKYLKSNSGYYDVAESSVRCAMELYGNCSYEAMQTYKAWKAVGINDVSFSWDYDAALTCWGTHFFNNFLPNIYVSTFGRIEADCDISSINKPVIFSAGSEIRLLSGFVSNNDFHAYICDQTPQGGGSSHKSIGNNSGYYTNEDENKNNTKEQQKQKDAVVIYPNPNKGTFTLVTNINPQEVISVQVFSMLGQSVYKQEGLPNSTVQLPSSTSGVFYVEILTKTEKFIRKMVVN